MGTDLARVRKFLLPSLEESYNTSIVPDKFSPALGPKSPIGFFIMDFQGQDTNSREWVHVPEFRLASYH